MIIGQLKEKVFAEEIKTNRVRLIYQGKNLEDHMKMSEIHLTKPLTFMHALLTKLP